ncbi:hypothetical protein SAMN05444392_11818 [Seinonella peptonophila]|uniref:Uncharacterized protein n=1 Tax=Seinonella peptonophila TaxID=112248 RepID=A0A1M5B4Q8_9BACL|nr:hypothetical protein [Seinonella peptonophila]SHF37317.1 hypothetical protein SAMN05444392_11818 [Seinonella peptonophila]
MSNDARKKIIEDLKGLIGNISKKKDAKFLGSDLPEQSADEVELIWEAQQYHHNPEIVTRNYRMPDKRIVVEDHDPRNGTFEYEHGSDEDIARIQAYRVEHDESTIQAHDIGKARKTSSGSRIVKFEPPREQNHEIIPKPSSNDFSDASIKSGLEQDDHTRE